MANVGLPMHNGRSLAFHAEGSIRYGEESVFCSTAL